MSTGRGERGTIKGALISFFLFILVACSFLVFVCLFVFGKVVLPNEIGVRRYSDSFFGKVNQGFEPVGLEPGLHWQVPPIGPLKLIASEVTTLPRDFQLVSLIADKKQEGEITLPPLNVQTSVGAKVLTDVTLVFRFFSKPLATIAEAKKGEPVTPSSEKLVESSAEQMRKEVVVPLPVRKTHAHGGPKNLLETFGSSLEAELGQFTDMATKLLRNRLKELSTTDYYNPMLREKAVLAAHEEINNLGNPYGIELWATLMRRSVYAEKKIDDQIFAKNLQDQIERLNSAANELAAAQAKTEQARALWDAKIRDLEVGGEGKVKVLRSEGDLYETKKVAEGEYLVIEAGAKVDTEKAGALHEISGAEIYVAREMAPLLGTLRGGVVTELDPFDMNQWVGKLSGKSVKAKE